MKIVPKKPFLTKFCEIFNPIRPKGLAKSVLGPRK